MGQPKNVDKGVAGIKLAIGIQKESGGNVNILARMGIFPAAYCKLLSPRTTSRILFSNKDRPYFLMARFIRIPDPQ